MRLPKLPIAHQLFLLLTCAVVLAVVVVGGLSVWNLQRGFSDYLRLRDEEQLTRLVQLVERRATLQPDMEWLRDDHEAMRELMDTFAGRAPRGPRPGPRPGEGPRRPDQPPPPPPPSQAPPAGNLPQRIMIRDAQGLRLGGREAAPSSRITTRAVKVDGVVVASIELADEVQPEGVDARFLQRQYLGLAGAGGITILAALLAAWWIGGRWSRPLRALQNATQRIARGDLTVQIPVGNAPGALHASAVEIEQLITDVNAMTTALSTLESARRIWIAEISHELRTPLAVLRGELESIEDGARQATPQVMASLCEEVLQLTRLVDDLHLLAVSDVGQMPCELRPGDANDALLRMVRRFETRAQQMGLSMHTPASTQPIAVTWDFGRVEQLLSNLLENSLRYTTAPGQIRVSWQASATSLTLEVHDSAPGVAAAHLPKLFEPLFRADAARTRTGQHGSGLGLSIVQAIARAHRGSVVAQASPLGGVAVKLVLPLHPQRLERRKREP
jgi:two-component system sensor histidine kinase BaeS